MKKFFSALTLTLEIAFTLALVLGVCLALFTGCEDGESTTTMVDETIMNTDTDENVLVDIEPIVHNFKNMPSVEGALETYRMEVVSRIGRGTNGTYFISEEEKNILNEEGYYFMNETCLIYKMTEYWYPVVYLNEQGGVEMWYTSDNGYVYREHIQGTESSIRGERIGHAHYDEGSEAAVVVHQTGTLAIAFNSEIGKVAFWSFGELQEECILPNGAIYTGVSGFEGYLFRAGTDVYAIKNVGTTLPTDGEAYVQVIAHNVHEVILADYRAGSDDWSQPLFLMEDGTLKVYCNWYGDVNAPADDSTHLKPIRYEGGYRY